MRALARGRRVAGAIAVVAAIASLSPASAHEPLDPKTAGELLLEVSALQARGRAGERTVRAAAAFELGETVRSIIEILNRDLAAHDGRLGLGSQMLVDQLERRGIALSPWPQANRYRSYLAPYRTYLDLDAGGSHYAEALLRLLQGRFYDSFLYDPLQPGTLDWIALSEQIEVGEIFLAAAPDHAEREEAAFIVAVNYLRATRLAPTSALASGYGERARAALEAFARAYPDSMRARAAQVLVKAVGGD